MPPEQKRHPTPDTPQRRVRVSLDLPSLRPTGENGFPYARKREIHRHGSPDRELGYLLESDAWQTIVDPLAEAIDQARRRAGKRGPDSSFDAEQVIATTLVRVVLRSRNLKDTLVNISSTHTPHTAIRRMLDLDTPHENRSDRRLERPDGVPHKSTIYRIIKKHVPLELIRDTLAAVHHELTLQLFEYAQVREDAKLLFLDTLRHKTHYTAARYDPKTGELTNPGRITAPGAGYLAISSGLKRAGDGFKAPVLITRSGLVLHCSAMPMNLSEIGAGETAVKALGLHYGHVLPPRGILVADGGFASDSLRADIRKLGFIDIIHDVSHGEDGRLRALQENKRRLNIHGYPNWHANGHRELICACGRGRTERQFGTLKDGTVVPRLIGRCPECRTVTITSGKWRTVRPRQPRPPQRHRSALR